MRIYQPTYRDRKSNELRKSRTWWLEFWVEGRRFNESLKTRDKTAALSRASTRTQEEARRAVGLVDPYAERRARPLLDHVDDFRVLYLEANRRSEQHRRELLKTLRDFAAATADEGQALGDMTQDAAVRWLNAEAESRGWSARSYNKAREHLRTFGRWLAVKSNPRRLPENPFPNLPRRDQDAERVLERRALEPEELRALVVVAPLYRKASYMLAATSGLRRKELRSLVWANVDLDRAAVTISARSAKNRKTETLPLPPETVELLRQHRGDARESHPVFPRVPGVDTLYRDLGKAGIPVETEHGKVDFHALRHTYARMLELSGVSLRQAQALMRHSVPRLTANVYQSPTLRDGRRAVAKLAGVLKTPKVSSPAPPIGREPLKTGTCGDTVLSSKPLGLANNQVARFDCE
ncbi:tyrosine-type recombinase/integrase [Planctomycetota bacterium]|nr:tyrosine-type recombinase/integrase [Planctomycetota bacterium]